MCRHRVSVRPPPTSRLEPEAEPPTGSRGRVRAERAGPGGAGGEGRRGTREPGCLGRRLRRRGRCRPLPAQPGDSRSRSPRGSPRPARAGEWPAIGPGASRRGGAAGGLAGRPRARTRRRGHGGGARVLRLSVRRPGRSGPWQWVAAGCSAVRDRREVTESRGNGDAGTGRLRRPGLLTAHPEREPAAAAERRAGECGGAGPGCGAAEGRRGRGGRLRCSRAARRAALPTQPWARATAVRAPRFLAAARRPSAGGRGAFWAAARPGLSKVSAPGLRGGFRGGCRRVPGGCRAGRRRLLRASP